MTLKELKEKIDKVFAEHPELADETVAADLQARDESVWLEVAAFIEDEEPSEDNDYAPAGHWKCLASIGSVEVEQENY